MAYIVGGIYGIIQAILAVYLATKNGSTFFILLTISFLISLLISFVGAYKMYSQGIRIVELAGEIEKYADIGECGSAPLSLIPFAEVSDSKDKTIHYYLVNLLLCSVLFFVETIFIVAVIIMKH